MKRKYLGILVVSICLVLVMGGASSMTGCSKESGQITLKVLSPRSEIEQQTLLGISPRLADLAGKTIGLVDNTKTGTIYFFDSLEEELKGRFPTASILRFRKKGYVDVQPELYKEVAEKCDAFVFGIGD
jgi:ABC-type amino acid transport substrate-binding protein